MNRAPKNGAVVYPGDESLADGALWVLGSWLKKLLAACRANAPVTKPGSGLKFTLTDDGLQMEVDGDFGDKSDLEELSIFATNDNEFPMVGVRWGTLNNDAPNGFPADISNPFLFAPLGGTNEVYLRVETDEDTLLPTSVAINTGSAMPEPTENLAFDRIGIYKFEAGILTILSRNTGSRFYVNGNGEHFFWR